MRRLPMPILAYFAVMAALPLFMGTTGLFYDAFQAIFVFSLVGLGLNVVTGFTGLLNLGMAAFMAIGAYTFAILTSDIYPFQIGFWWGSWPRWPSAPWRASCSGRPRSASVVTTSRSSPWASARSPSMC